MRGDSENTSTELSLFIKLEEQMEELSWGAKIIGISICVAFFILLLTGDKLKQMLRRSFKPNKTK
jgi:hypothetical protein